MFRLSRPPGGDKPPFIGGAEDGPREGPDMRRIEIVEGLSIRFPNRSEEFLEGFEIGLMAASLAFSPRDMSWMFPNPRWPRRRISRATSATALWKGPRQRAGSPDADPRRRAAFSEGGRPGGPRCLVRRQSSVPLPLAWPWPSCSPPRPMPRTGAIASRRTSRAAGSISRRPSRRKSRSTPSSRISMPFWTKRASTTAGASAPGRKRFRRRGRRRACGPLQQPHRAGRT